MQGQWRVVGRSRGGGRRDELAGRGEQPEPLRRGSQRRASGLSRLGQL